VNKKIVLEALDVNNWQKICNLSVTDEQKTFFPIPNVYWIGISRYEEKTELFAIKADDEYVGLIGGGFDEDGITGYINPIMIDQHFQKNGYGKQAVQLIFKHLQKNLHVDKINMGHRKINNVSGHLFESFGFKIIKDNGNSWYRQLELDKD
jgi:diamine N-acetyltransferase